MQSKLVGIPAATVFGLFHPVLLLAQEAQQPGAPWPSPWHWHGGWGLWWIFPLFVFLMVALCVARCFIFSRHRSGADGDQSWGLPWGPCCSSGDSRRSALKILHERFAKGEIQKEEYEEKKAAVSSRV